MNRKFALYLACFAVSCVSACNESAHLEYPCEEGARSCHLDKIVVCTDGEEVVEKTCPNGMMCDPAKVECSDVFQIQCSNEDERKCLHNYLLVCRDGEWRVLESCGEGQTCNAETSTCDGGEQPVLCNEAGERKCEDNKVMVCEDTWIVEKSCLEDEVCNEETFECDPKTIPEPCDEEGARKCDDNRVMICADGEWGVEKTCQENETCNDSTFECDPNGPEPCDEEGATRCSSDAAQIETCTEGIWTGENCDESLHCVATDDGPLCAECDNEDTRCIVEDGVSLLSKCVNYRWEEAQACLDLDPEKQVCDANPGKSCVNVLELLQCPEEGTVACQDVYGQEYAVICENGIVTEASGICEDGKVCYVPEGGCTTPDECGNETVGAGEDCEEGMLGDATCATVTGDASATGALACTSCKYDLSACLYCGDGIVNNTEVCDGSVPEDATCTTVINDGKVYIGTLSCKDDCTFDITNCKEAVVEDCTPENCTTDKPNATASCVENVCTVTCNDGFMDVDGVCTSTSCTAADTKCGEGVFYLCGSNGTLESIPMPEDGKHYICDAATSTGWVEVECLEASHCSTTDEHATVDCVANACVVTCNDHYTDVNGVCTEVVCEPGVNTCEDVNLMVCNAKGTGYELVEPCTTTDPNATATCEANACKVACNINFIDVGGVCTPIVCETGAKACNGADLMVCNEKGTDYELGETCTNAPENATALCNDTEGVCSFECNDGYLINSDGTGCDREILACNFQWIAKDDGAFGNVALNGKTKDDYEGRLVCIDQTDSTKIITLDAVYNKDVDTNVEFGVLDLSGIESGKYNCTFEFKLASSSSWYACQGVDYSGTWADPILIDSDDYSVIPSSEWYREYSVQMCEPDSKVCDGDGLKVCAADGMSYGEVTPCEKPDHAETMACNVDKCEVAACEGNWSVTSTKDGCECTGEYVLDGTECKAKCTDADTKCEGDNYYKCEESGLVTTSPKPTDGQNYVCKDDSGWVVVACTEASQCTAVDHATMACNENVCEVASCEGNWSVTSGKDACECTGEYVLNGEECVAKCTDTDTKCEGDNYYKCEESGLVTTEPKPTDGKHYICKDASGWEVVACTEDSHCTAVDHATMACNAENACEVASCEGNWSVTSGKDACECVGNFVLDAENNCIEKCTSADTKCDGDTFYKCGSDGLVTTNPKPTDGKHYICDPTKENGWVEVGCELAADCTAVDHATMACNENICEVASCEGNWSVTTGKDACECTGDYVLNGEECIAKCTSADTKCDGDNYYKCEESGLVTTEPKPTDGKHYICKDASGWEAVACTEASHCTAVDHATVACNDNVCEVASCEGNWSVTSGKDACECVGNFVLDAENNCIEKCTSADTKCVGDTYYQCEESGLVTTEPKPTDGKHYICKDASGWEVVACTEASHCTAVDHATMACTDNTCVVASCEGNWSVTSGKDACECTGDYVLDGTECVAKCTSADTKCEGDNYYQCESTGLVSTNPKPTDGKHYICNASEGGWISVACTEASHCTAVEHATMACNENVCEVASCEGNWSVTTGKDACECVGDYAFDGTDCVAVICAPGSKACDTDGTNVLVCNVTGTGYETKTCTTDVENAVPMCTTEFECSYRCAAGFAQVGEECVAETCNDGDKICNDTNDGLLVCNATGTGYEAGDPCTAPDNAKPTCDSGVCDFDCNGGYIKNTSSDPARCDREILACNFQHIGETGAYGNVALNGKTKDDYNGRVVCVDQTDATRIITLDAVYNKAVDTNVEFGVVDMSSIDAGKYNCTFEFKLADSSTWFACQGVDYEAHWADPIAIYDNDLSVLPEGWYREYSKLICTPDARECVGENQYKVCASDGMSYSEVQTCDTAVANGYAICSGAGECGFACNESDGYVKDGDVCRATFCLDVNGDRIENGEDGCETANRYNLCNDGQWSTDSSLYEDCEWGCDAVAKSCKAPVGCTDANGSSIAHGGIGCGSANQVAECKNGEMVDAFDCEVANATATVCTGNGDCMATACGTGYHLGSGTDEGKCVVNVCEPNTYICDGTNAYSHCNGDGSDYDDIGECDAKANADVVAECAESGSSVECKYTCKEGYAWKDGVENTECELVATLPCTDAVSGLAVESGAQGCATATAYGECVNGEWAATECVTAVDNAHAVCNPTLTNYCTFACNEGTTPSANGSSCIEDINVEWCKFQWLNSPQDAGGRILFPAGKGDTDVTPYMICTSEPTQTFSNWDAVDFAYLNTDCNESEPASDPCGSVNKEYQIDETNTYTGVAGTNYCAFVFDFGNQNIFVCPKDGGAGVRVTNDTVLNEEQYRTFDGDFCIGKGDGTFCNGDVVTTCAGGVTASTSGAYCDETNDNVIACSDGSFVSGETVECAAYGRVCSNATCKEVTVSACDFDWLDSSGAYGIVYHQDNTHEDYVARLVCINTQDSSDIKTLAAEYLEPDGSNNDKFYVSNLTDIAGGNYECSFQFSGRNSNQWYACSDNWSPDPVLIDSTDVYETLADSYFKSAFCINRATDHDWCNGETWTKCADNGTISESYYCPDNDGKTCSMNGDNGHCAVCEAGATKCGEGDDAAYIYTCVNNVNEEWTKATDACAYGCGESPDNPGSYECLAKTIMFKPFSSIFTKTNTGTGYNAEFEFVNDGLTISVKGNNNKNSTTGADDLYMQAGSYIHVTGLSSVSEITINYRTNANDNGFKVSAGSYSETVSSVAKSDDFISQTFIVTDSTATGFEIDNIVKKAIIVESISWK